MQSSVTCLFCLMNFTLVVTLIESLTELSSEKGLVLLVLSVVSILQGWEGMGGCGKEKTLILWHHMARKEGWREVDGYACTAAPVCSAHVWEVCGMCTPVCAGTLAHVYECDACMTYIQMYVQVYEQCMWKSEEDVLNLALALSAMLFWDRVSTKSGARLVARKPQWSSCFFPWRCWGYRCLWLWCAENLNTGCCIPAAGALIHRIISLAFLFVWAVSFTKLQFTDWLVRLAGQSTTWLCTPQIHRCMVYKCVPACRTFPWVLGIWIHVFKLVQQSPCWINCLPCSPFPLWCHQGDQQMQWFSHVQG